MNLAHAQSATSRAGSTAVDSDLASCLSVLREAIALATSRNDSQLYVALRIQECRLLLEKTERARWPEVGTVLTELEHMVGRPAGAGNPNGQPGEKPAEKPVAVPQMLKAQLLLLLCLYHSLVGDVKAAKDWLKQVHAIMDDTEREDGEDEGVLRVRRPPCAHESGLMPCRYRSILLLLFPRQAPGSPRCRPWPRHLPMGALPYLRSAKPSARSRSNRRQPIAPRTAASTWWLASRLSSWPPLPEGRCTPSHSSSAP